MRADFSGSMIHITKASFEDFQAHSIALVFRRQSHNLLTSMSTPFRGKKRFKNPLCPTCPAWNQRPKKFLMSWWAAKVSPVHECCSDHLVERFDEQLTFSSAVHSDFTSAPPEPWSFYPGVKESSSSAQAQLESKLHSCWRCLYITSWHCLTYQALHFIMSVYSLLQSFLDKKTSLQWVLMERVGSVPRLPESERRLKLSGWLLIKHDLASISSVILGLIFNDAPHFTFCGPFHLFKWLVCRWTDSCNCDWRTLMWLLNRWPGSLVTKRANPAAKAAKQCS